MEIRQLYYFFEIARQGSFSKAAEVLYVTQPTISQQIASLEKELDMSLFSRTTKKVLLTAEGEKFLEPCRQVIDAYDRLLETCGKKPMKQETLHVGVFPFYKSVGLEKKINAFYLKYQDVNGMIKCLENNKAYELLEEGTLDFAIIKCRDDVLRKDMHYDELLYENLRVLIRRDHRLAVQKAITVEQLACLPLLTGETDSHYYQEMKELYRKIGITFKTKFQTTLEIEMMLDMVSAGAGILLLSDSAGLFSESEEVISIPLSPPQEVGVYLVYPRKAVLRPIDKMFRTYILDEFGK